EIAPAATAMAQGLTGFFAGRPGVQPVYRGYSFLVPADKVVATLEIDGATREIASPRGPPTLPESTPEPVGRDISVWRTVPLVELAVGRSGDKGNAANIGVIARRPEDLPLIRSALTPGAVAGWFSQTGVTHVDRFDLPGIHALNFVLHDCLGGGGVGSLRIDPQGKAFAQMLMDFPVPVPAGFTPARRGG
ncbi:MAG: hypothetical protein FD152_3391, partial [Xanthobacteraceae bacterium]